jgi:hypothetical protein
MIKKLHTNKYTSADVPWEFEDHMPKKFDRTNFISNDDRYKTLWINVH